MAKKTPQHKPVTLIRRPQVETRTGKSRSTIYADIQAGTFPAPVRIGARSVAWIESEIDAWLDKQIAASRSA